MRILVVSNRLPVVVERRGEEWCLQPGSGGLVTALSAALRHRGGTWIGWPGIVDADVTEVARPLAAFGREAAYDLEPVWLTAEEHHGFYHGFSNEIIWPLFHDLQSLCNFDPNYWRVYGAVQERFADAVVRRAGPADFIWAQDYHLMGLGYQLRQRGCTSRIAFFLHTPFPPPDIFCKLPWRADVLESLFTYDLIGFQTPRDRDNFADCVRRLKPKVRLQRGRGGLHTLRHEGRSALVGAFPIGIDYAEFGGAAASERVSQRVHELREEMPNTQIILGLDRLDYTKGIPYRLKAFRLALERYPELHRNVTLLQVVIPSREAVPEYQELKAEIERLVSQVNGEFTQPGWVPIHHVFRSLEREELLAFYRVADVALITPLKDGMNLVAKEYCACQIDGNGVLILSEFAGAAVQLGRDALLVNPYDSDHVAEAIRAAVSKRHHARRPAMRRMRRAVERQDVYWWTEQFLRASGIDTDIVKEAEQPAAEVPEMQVPLPPASDVRATWAWTS